MKKKVFVLVSVLLATFISVINPSQANAGECSAADPCDNWAVVNNEGIVTTVIVCQESVCGVNGEWGGTLDGNKLVPQVAADPLTHMASGSYATNQNDNVLVTENNGVFVIEHNAPKQEFFEDTSSDFVTTYKTEVSSSRYQFSYQDSMGVRDGSALQLTEIEPKNNTSATLSAMTKFTNGLSVEEKEIFLNRSTPDEIKEKIIKNQFSVILARIQVLIQKLGKWVK